MSKNPDVNMFNSLNIPGWRATCFIAVDGEAGCEEAPDDIDPEDPTVVRWEQWIVAGDQYIFMDRAKGTEEWGSPELGEYEHLTPGHVISPFQISCLEDLVEIMAWRINEGQAEQLHPVIRALVTEDDLRDAANSKTELRLKNDATLESTVEQVKLKLKIDSAEPDFVSKLIKVAKAMRKWVPLNDQASEELLTAVQEYDTLPEFYRV